MTLAGGVAPVGEVASVFVQHYDSSCEPRPHRARYDRLDAGGVQSTRSAEVGMEFFSEVVSTMLDTAIEKSRVGREEFEGVSLPLS